MITLYNVQVAFAYVSIYVRNEAFADGMASEFTECKLAILRNAWDLVK